MFIINFRNTETIKSYSDATLAGRIYIEFPTIATLGTAAFANDLGTSLKTGNIIPCSFKDSSGVGGVPAYFSIAKCILRCSEVASTPAVIEIINFIDVPIGTLVTIRILGVKNPTIDNTNVIFNIKVNHIT